MRSIPTPSSLNLTKTTCEYFYHPSGKRWFTVLVDGNTWVTNGHVLMKDVPPFKGVEKFIGQVRAKYKTDKIIADAATHNHTKLYLGKELLLDDTACVLLTDERERQIAAIKTKYAELLRWTYPNCDLYGADGNSSVSVIDEHHHLVAVVMPVRM